MTIENRLLSIWEKDVDFFVRPVLFHLAVSDYANLTILNVDSKKVDREVALLRMVQCYGLFQEFLQLYRDNNNLGWVKRLTNGKSYSVDIKITHERVDVVKRTGFGMLFYNVDTMYAVLREFQNGFSNSIYKDSRFDIFGLDIADLEMLSDFFVKLNDFNSRTTDQIIFKFVEEYLI
jgi:hypothetical protein